MSQSKEGNEKQPINSVNKQDGQNYQSDDNKQKENTKNFDDFPKISSDWTLDDIGKYLINLNQRILDQNASIQQLSNNLDNRISEQNASIQQLSSNLNNRISEQNASIQQLSSNLSNPISEQDTSIKQLSRDVVANQNYYKSLYSKLMIDYNQTIKKVDKKIDEISNLYKNYAREQMSINQKNADIEESIKKQKDDTNSRISALYETINNSDETKGSFHVCHTGKIDQLTNKVVQIEDHQKKHDDEVIKLQEETKNINVLITPAIEILYSVKDLINTNLK